MTMRQMVEESVTTNWPEFARRHSELAAELTRADYVDATVSTLRNDPAYRKALARGQLAADALDLAADTVNTTVRAVMRLGA